MKKLTLLCILLSSIYFTNEATAQSNQAIGLRLGPYLGVTYQAPLSNEAVLELIFATRYRGIAFTALYEVHKDSFDVEGLQWYYGGGGHIGFYQYYAGHPYWHDENPGSTAIIGVDGILGIEYFIPNAPVQLSLDWKPNFNFVGYSGFEGDNGALSVRFTF